ncbi:MAG: DUF4835 family protein [Bacteroidetes bacterium]|nr:MAG: DUF4835 family protein [Bacteroidota bacterium]
MRKLGVLGLFLLCFGFNRAQELNCQVSIVVDNQIPVTSVEQEVFDLLKQTVYELMNNTKWTKDNFKLEERINCNIQIQINSIPQTGTYSGMIQVQSTRPVYNSSYNTTLINFQDENVTFNFSRNAILIYAPNQYRDELTSILAFYAYMILGMDYDSFSLKGGTAYFKEAQQVVSIAQSAGGPGWLASDRKKSNRFYMVDNVLQPLYESLRNCNYEYHRKGLDQLFDNPVEARKAMNQSLSKLTRIVGARPNSINVLNFVQAKSIEIKNIFQDAENDEKTQVVNTLKRVDPANSSRYQEILN